MASGGIHPSSWRIETRKARSDLLPQPRLFGNISQTRQKMKRPTFRRPLVCVLFLEQPPSSLHQKPALAKEPTHRRVTPFFALFSLVWILFKILAGFQIRFVSFLDKYIAWKSDKSNAQESEQKGLRRGVLSPRRRKWRKLLISLLDPEYQSTRKFKYCEHCIL